MIKSPLNYSGNKFRLLNQILPHFPKEIDTFVDLFGGSGTVSANANSNKIIYNEVNPWVSGIVKMFIEKNPETLIKAIEHIISIRGLSKQNQEAFMQIRDDFNTSPHYKNPLYLYVISCYAFSNQIRFNKNNEFNTPFGRNRQHFSDNMKANIPLFKNAFNGKEVTVLNKSFLEVEIPEDAFVYADPPYLGTTAVYNEQGGWGESEEEAMYEYLLELNSRNIKWALSNDLGKNKKILEWAIENEFTIIDLNYDYSRSSYQSKREFGDTREVLIINY